jgi:hypothetical protein
MAGVRGKGSEGRHRQVPRLQGCGPELRAVAQGWPVRRLGCAAAAPTANSNFFLPCFTVSCSSSMASVYEMRLKGVLATCTVSRRGAEVGSERENGWGVGREKEKSADSRRLLFFP